jgi:hypothetical protein
LPRSEAASNRCVDAPNSGVETHELVRQDDTQGLEIELVVGGRTDQALSLRAVSHSAASSKKSRGPRPHSQVPTRDASASDRGSR